MAAVPLTRSLAPSLGRALASLVVVGCATALVACGAGPVTPGTGESGRADLTIAAASTTTSSSDPSSVGTASTVDTQAQLADPAPSSASASTAPSSFTAGASSGPGTTTPSGSSAPTATTSVTTSAAPRAAAPTSSTASLTTGAAGAADAGSAVPGHAPAATGAPSNPSALRTVASTGSAAGALLTFGPGIPATAEAAVIRLVNVQRTAVGCAPLAVSPLLVQVARAHSQEMAASGTVRHNSPDGRTPFQRLTAVGYDYSIATENIAAGQPNAAAVMSAWMGSEEHRTNMLDCRLTQIGVGVVNHRGSRYGTYWTQDIATPM